MNNLLEPFREYLQKVDIDNKINLISKFDDEYTDQPSYDEQVTELMIVTMCEFLIEQNIIIDKEVVELITKMGKAI